MGELINACIAAKEVLQQRIRNRQLTSTDVSFGSLAGHFLVRQLTLGKAVVQTSYHVALPPSPIGLVILMSPIHRHFDQWKKEDLSNTYFNIAVRCASAMPAQGFSAPGPLHSPASMPDEI